MLKRLFTLAAAILLLSTSAYAQPPQSSSPAAPSPVLDQTWTYLDEHPAGSRSILAYALGGRPIKENAVKQLDILLENGISTGFSSAEELSYGIIGLAKQALDPLAYKKTDLLALLSSYDNIYREGLTGAYLTLNAYKCSGEPIQTAVRNNESSVIDYIVSSQQRSGGFARTAGKDPSVRTTAGVLTALSAHAEIPYVKSAIDKAFYWLSAVQNADGSFSAGNAPSCEATAEVLTALRACGLSPDDDRFLKEGHDLRDALLLFRNTDGGYAETIGGDSEVAATEAAVLALLTNDTGCSPYLPPASYPGYVSPEPTIADSISAYKKFFFYFIGVLTLVYLIVLLTGKIGEKWGTFPTEAPPAESSGNDPLEDTQTLELHIPMQAELPNFDEISEAPDRADQTKTDGR